jgi:hypothetical protein
MFISHLLYILVLSLDPPFLPTQSRLYLRLVTSFLVVVSAITGKIDVLRDLHVLYIERKIPQTSALKRWRILINR